MAGIGRQGEARLSAMRFSVVWPGMAGVAGLGVTRLGPDGRDRTRLFNI